MRKRLGNVYDKWSISVVICDIFSIAVNQVIYGDDRKTFEVMIEFKFENVKYISIYLKNIKQNI